MTATLISLVLLLGTPSFANWMPQEGQPKPAATGPMAGFSALIGPAWRAEGEGFATVLTYRWLLPYSAVAVTNEVMATDGTIVARYAGNYVWDAGRQEIAFLTASQSGEMHRGRAWWQGGVLWHEAEVSGGDLVAYASALRLQGETLEYFADYGATRAVPALLDGKPLLYTPAQ